MKINELKTPKPALNEGFLDALIGDYGAAGLRSMFKRGMTTKAQLAQDIFIKDFIGDATASINNAIKSGVVNPKIAGSAKPAAKPADPNAGKFAGNPAADTPANPTGKNAAATDPYENLKGQMRQLQPQPGAKPLPDKFATSLQGDMAKLAKGDKESGTYAADKILKFAKAGYDVSKLAPTWTASSKAGERFLTQSVYRAISNMLREYGLSWENLGLRIRLDESVGNKGVFISRGLVIPVVTPEYKKLNQVFESIVNVNELFGNTLQPNAGAESLEQFLTAWFGKYMQGVNWEAKKGMLLPLIKDVADSYPRIQGPLKQLARGAYAVSSAYGHLPAGAPKASDTKPDDTSAEKKGGFFGGLGAPAGGEAEKQLKTILKNNPELAKKYGIKA
jgi:hypothetical protein